MYDFALFLGVDISYFFEGLDDYKVPDQKPSYALDKTINNFEANGKSKEMQSLIKAFKAISNPEVRKNIVLLIQSL